VREIVDDEEWHRSVWDRHHCAAEREDGFEEDGMGFIEEKCLAETVRIEDFLQRNCPLMH
jgi:hypothetical protein